MKFYTIQLYRFIAALLVMFHHLDITRSGNIGVYIFFVISGFVIYLKLFSTGRPSPFSFFVNRLTKIFLLYWLALIIMYIVSPFPLDNSTFNTIFLIPGHISQLRVSWSLSNELYFYFLTGLAAYLVPKKYSWPFLVLLLIISGITAVLTVFGWIQIQGTAVNFFLGKNSLTFFLGLLSGYLFANVLYPAKIPAFIPLFILSCLLLSAALIYPLDFKFPALITGLASLLLVAFSAAYEKRIPLPARTAFIFGILGDASYAIYLFAPVFGNIIHGRSSFDKMSIIILTILFSIFINRMLERPALAFCRRKIILPVATQ